MSGLDHLWAGWRGEYIAGAGQQNPDDGCAFCRVLASDEPEERVYVVWRDDVCAALLNLYPYTSGHVLVMPVRHCGALDGLDAGEAAALWNATRSAVAAITKAYGPEGVNIGANLGRAAGAGIPGHLHLHALPRWGGDTNFLTTIANARVLPETLEQTYAKVRAAWPS